MPLRAGGRCTWNAGSKRPVGLLEISRALYQRRVSGFLCWKLRSKVHLKAIVPVYRAADPWDKETGERERERGGGGRDGGREREGGDREREREREREEGRETDRQTDRQTGRMKERERMGRLARAGQSKCKRG